MESPPKWSAVVHVEPEPVESGLGGVTKVLLPEQVLDAREQRVVVVRGAADRSRSHERGQDESADAADPCR